MPKEYVLNTLITRNQISEYFGFLKLDTVHIRATYLEWWVMSDHVAVLHSSALGAMPRHTSWLFDTYSGNIYEIGEVSKKSYSWNRRDATNSDRIHRNEKKIIMNNGTFASPESLMCKRLATQKKKPTAEVNKSLCAIDFELV